MGESNRVSHHCIKNLKLSLGIVTRCIQPSEIIASGRSFYTVTRVTRRTYYTLYVGILRGNGKQIVFAGTVGHFKIA